MTLEPTDCALVIPTRNAGKSWQAWLQAFQQQDFIPGYRIIIDSSSKDATPALARQYGFHVHSIRPEDFDHAATRNIGLNLANNASRIVFMSQDAIFAKSDSLRNLYAALNEPAIGAAYGRQLPYPDADPVTTLQRQYSYGPISARRSVEDIPKLGIRAALLSNAFAVYKRQALESIHGFYRNTICCEDLIAGGRLLFNGWDLYYAANAEVYHSHDYNWVQEFRRTFDIGVSYAREPWLRQKFGHAENEGRIYAQYLFRYLYKKHPEYLPNACMRLLIRFSAFQLGLFENLLPLKFKKHFSMNAGYWNVQTAAMQAAKSAE